MDILETAVNCVLPYPKFYGEFAQGDCLIPVLDTLLGFGELVKEGMIFKPERGCLPPGKVLGEKEEPQNGIIYKFYKNPWPAPLES